MSGPKFEMRVGRLSWLFFLLRTTNHPLCHLMPASVWGRWVDWQLRYFRVECRINDSEWFPFTDTSRMLETLFPGLYRVGNW